MLDERDAAIDNEALKILTMCKLGIWQEIEKDSRC